MHFMLAKLFYSYAIIVRLKHFDYSVSVVCWVMYRIICLDIYEDCSSFYIRNYRC